MPGIGTLTPNLSSCCHLGPIALVSPINVGLPVHISLCRNWESTNNYWLTAVLLNLTLAGLYLHFLGRSGFVKRSRYAPFLSIVSTRPGSTIPLPTTLRIDGIVAFGTQLVAFPQSTTGPPTTLSGGGIAAAHGPGF